jgi:hypothetical protein
MAALGQATDQIVRRPVVVLGHQHAQREAPLFLTANLLTGDERDACDRQYMSTMDSY